MINLDPLWNNFDASTSGAGTSVATGRKLAASALVGDTGYHKCNYPAAPGEIYILSCDARVLSNNGTDPKPGMFIDYPAFPNTNNRVFFDSDQWKSYKLRFAIYDEHERNADFFTIGLGSWTITDGSCEILNPILRVEKVTPMTPSLWAYAWVEIDNAGAVTILEQNNITSAAWTSGAGVADSFLTIVCPGIPSSILNVQPRPKAIGTTTGPDQYIPKADYRITGVAAGDFQVKILDTNLSTYIQSNPASTTRFYVEVSY